MAGIVYRIIPKQNFDFSTWAAAQSALMLMAKNVDITNFREATLILRLHAWTITQSPSLAISARIDAPTTEDPGQDFAGGSDLVSLSAIFSGVVAPTVQTAALPANLPAALRIYMTPTQSNPTPGTFKVTLSADLVAKS